MSSCHYARTYTGSGATIANGLVQVEGGDLCSREDTPGNAILLDDSQSQHTSRTAITCHSKTQGCREGREIQSKTTGSNGEVCQQA